jgi:hypothetical protein
MIRIESGPLSRNCAGVSRRGFLQAGFLGAAGLSLADLYRLRAASADPAKRKSTACILIWLDGGPPQHETYDPKPDAPAEYRGAYKAIETSVPGLQVCELLPHTAKVAHRMAFVRSVYHDNGDHFAGGHIMLTGRWGATGGDQVPRYPSMASYVAKLRGANRPDLPPYVGLPVIHSIGIVPGYHGASYLGAQYDPFQADIQGGNDSPRVGTPKLFRMKADEARLGRRAGLLEKVDDLKRRVENHPQIEKMDFFSHQALNTLLSPAVRDAFDLDAEPAKAAERYGDHPWCRWTLLARRLVERGVTFVTVTMGGWDMHDNIAGVVKDPAKAMDRAVGSLVQDLDERGMLQDVLVIVMGEFGRTPKLNTTGVPGQTGLPGRDHWGNVMSVAMAGGGLRMGQAVGASNANGEYPAEKPYRPEHVLATVYHVLGIDPRTEVVDREARPISILPSGFDPIPELV